MQIPDPHHAALSQKSRREFLGISMAASLVSAPGLARAQDVSAGRGAPVWMNYDQAALDRAYDQSNWAPNIKTVLERYVANSKLTRSHTGMPEKLRYGASDVENLELFRTKASDAPIHIFIHGGAWRIGEAQEYSFLAEASLAGGAHVLIPDFVNVVQANGNLMPMVEQVARSIAWAYRNAASFGGDPGRIFVSAHSSGAHLAAVALTMDWERVFGIPGDVIKGAILISGIYDLKPVRLSSRSSYVQISDQIEARLSPQRHVDRIRTPMILIHGTEESPEFIRQSRDFADAAAKRGRTVELIAGAGYNHFEILETLASPFGIAGRALLRQLDS